MLVQIRSRILFFKLGTVLCLGMLLSVPIRTPHSTEIVVYILNIYPLCRLFAWKLSLRGMETAIILCNFTNTIHSRLEAVKHTSIIEYAIKENPDVALATRAMQWRTSEDVVLNCCALIVERNGARQSRIETYFGYLFRFRALRDLSFSGTVVRDVMVTAGTRVRIRSRGMSSLSTGRLSGRRCDVRLDSLLGLGWDAGREFLLG
jgi:hypothetical protein